VILFPRYIKVSEECSEIHKDFVIKLTYDMVPQMKYYLEKSDQSFQAPGAT